MQLKNYMRPQKRRLITQQFKVQVKVHMSSYCPACISEVSDLDRNVADIFYWVQSLLAFFVYKSQHIFHLITSNYL